jgi:restriction system protein
LNQFHHQDKISPMPVPDFQSTMLPLLTYMADGQIRSIAETVDSLANEFQLTPEERNELIPSNRQTKFYNRVSWAHIYLARAGLLERQRRGYYQIAELGRAVLTQKPGRIDIQFLRQFPAFVQFHDAKSEVTSTEATSTSTTPKTPEEVMDDAYEEIRDNLAQEILAQVMKCSPSFFERMVVELLVKMGYGGSRSEAARAVGQTGDGGIDGIIDEDRLGLDTIYIQAKRWDTVPSKTD